jgi:hypothetical protein
MSIVATSWPRGRALALATTQEVTMNAARSRWTLATLLLVLTVGAPAAADPITVAYQVQVFQRSLREGAGPIVSEPFSQQFTLFMTFDPVAPAGSGVYGTPSFSPIPLPVPSAPDGLRYAEWGGTTHSALSTGGFFARADAGIFGSGSIGDNVTNYSRLVQLTGLVQDSERSLATPEAFPFHLAAGGFGPFNFSYSACLGVGPFGTDADSCTDARGPGTQIASYQGTATLQDAGLAPIPEPATMALVGSGLVLLGRRRKRSITPGA